MLSTVEELILTKKELKKLAGTPDEKKIKEWLAQLGINFLPNAKGFPNVSRELMNKKLIGDTGLKPIDNKKGDEESLRRAMGLK